MKQLIALLVLLNFLSHAQVYNYYYGNIHSHTGFSDGNQDSTTSGISKPSQSYAYAKQSQNFDFLGISEHNHYSSNNNPGFEIQNWPIGINMANSANQDGTFLCMYGMEWGVSSNYNGHVLIYNYPSLIGWENNNYQVFNAKTDYDGLFKKIKNQPGAFCTLAHPSYDDFSLAGNSATSLLNIAYNSGYDSAIVGTPLRNGIYNTTTTNYTAYPASNYFQYYKQILAKGYHLGISYDHDNHNTTFGRSNAGRLVVMMTSLTRANFYDAMQKMRFYASDDWNAKINFQLNGNVMGSILSGSVNPQIQLTHNDVDGEMADSIRIWRGVSGGAIAQVVSVTKQNNTSSYTDNSLSNDVEYYYFAEVKQNDGQWIVTSPIWYKKTIPAGLNEIAQALDFIFFPNPVSEKLSISLQDCDSYTVIIRDLSGRELYSQSVNDKDINVDLSAFSKGIYLLEVSNKDHKASKRLVIE